jgi:predicted Rdx family selenoprotein
MKEFKVGDRVRAVKDCIGDCFKKNETGTVISIDKYGANIQFDNDWKLYAEFDEIELIESEQCASTIPKQTVKIHENALRMFARANGLPGPGNGTHIITGTVPSDDPKPFPTFEEFNKWFAHEWDGDSDVIYNYFAQFQYEKTVEVYPEVGKEYEFSTDGMIWEKTELGGFKEAGANWTFKYIRPIQPSRLEQLKAKRPNLTQDEQTELIDLLLKKE